MADATVGADYAIVRPQLFAVAHRHEHRVLGRSAVRGMDQFQPAVECRSGSLRRLSVELLHGVAPPDRAVTVVQLVDPGACRAARHLETDRNPFELGAPLPLARRVRLDLPPETSAGGKHE